MLTIHWRLYIKATNPQAAANVLGRVCISLSPTTHIIQLKPYWKDEALFEATLVTDLDDDDIRSGVFTALRLGMKLARAWTVSGPHAFDRDIWQFDGYAAERDGFTVAGVTLASFELLPSEEGENAPSPSDRTGYGMSLDNGD